MATYTEHYNLIKPALNDKVNINNLNDNADIIDTALNNKVDTAETQNITTSAANCMMSDGVTSVEGAIDEVSSGLDNVIAKSLSVSNRSFTDFDTAVDGGLYLSPNYKTFNGSPQSTADDSCILLVLNDSPYTVQICISTFRFDNIYIRRNIGSGWLAWKRISLT